jgi:hypothetical protein
LVGVAVKVTEAPEQIVVPEPLAILTAGTTTGLTVMVTVLEVAVVGLAQAALDVSTQVTASELARVVEVKVAALVPTLVPFTFHWYAGVVPPLVGVAVKVTEAPEQIVVPKPLAMLTEGVTAVFTVIVMAFDVAVVGLAHGELEVSTQVTASLLARVVEVNVAAFVPTFVPLTFHWYAGVVPPLVGVAVKVTEAPAHIVVPDPLAIETVGATVPDTVMVMAFDVAVVGLAQGEFEVSIQVTTSLLAIVDEV